MITAIIPYYNSGATIERAVSSLLKQKHLPEEILIINDGSDAINTAILKTVTKLSPLVNVVHQENKGLSGARNTGILKSKGDYLLMLDADDTFETDFLEKAIPLIENDTTVGVVTCGVARIINGSLRYTYTPQKLTLRDCLIDNIVPACALFSKKAILEVGMYDINFVYGYEDWDLNIRLLSAGYRFKVIDVVLFNYYDTEGSLLKETKMKDLQLRKTLLTKYAKLYHLHLDIFIDEIDRQRQNKNDEVQKVKRGLEYVIGFRMLQPLRFLKRMIKKST